MTTSTAFDPQAAQAYVDGIESRYGVSQTGMAVNGDYHAQVDHSDQHTLRMVADKGGKITRVRVLKEGGKCDISYIHATLPDGKIVPVQVGVEHLIWFKGLRREFIAWAQREGVFAKSIDLLDESVWSVL